MAQSRLDEIRNARIEKLTALRDQGINPYPSKYSQDAITIDAARNKHGHTIAVRGRVMRWREHGNVIFADLKDDSGQIQLLFQKKQLEETFKTLKHLDMGDFIGVVGIVTTTQAGEITVDVAQFELLSKSLRPLPDDWHGLKDEELRYRQRYVDLLLNDDLKDLFRKKSLFWQTVRNFMLERQFLEVETPVLENTAGGADAAPFVTHHNALDTDLYLRISTGELWQKRLMVAGFEKTFEIGRQFRNEGIDREHLQDYTQMEFYWAYADFNDSMKLVEELYKQIAFKTFGTYEFTIGDHQIDLSVPWEKIDYVQTVLHHTGIDVSTATKEQLKAKLSELKISVTPADDTGRLIDLLWKTVRKTISGPVFLVGHPVGISPLAKRQADRPDYTEKFQIILAGSEMGNGYSELNDPVDQAQRFASQQALRDAGDAEAQMFDHDYVRALEYAMPPVSGFGLSERLFSFLANISIREAVLFPLLRPESPTSSFSSKQDFDNKFVIIIDPSLPAWKIMNTSGHLAAFLGNKMRANFDTGNHFTTQDGINLPRNSQFPVVTLSATSTELKELVKEVRKTNLLHLDYVNDMMETSDDKKLENILQNKPESDIDYAGLGIFGPKAEIDKLTKKLSLWKS